MFKKILAFTAALGMVITLSACAPEGNKSTDNIGFLSVTDTGVLDCVQIVENERRLSPADLIDELDANGIAIASFGIIENPDQTSDNMVNDKWDVYGHYAEYTHTPYTGKTNLLKLIPLDLDDLLEKLDNGGPNYTNLQITTKANDTYEFSYRADGDYNWYLKFVYMRNPNYITEKGVKIGDSAVRLEEEFSLPLSGSPENGVIWGSGLADDSIGAYQPCIGYRIENEKVIEIMLGDVFPSAD